MKEKPVIRDKEGRKIDLDYLHKTGHVQIVEEEALKDIQKFYETRRD